MELFTANNVWMMICTALVFLYAYGFCIFGNRIDQTKKYNQYFIQKHFYYHRWVFYYTI